MTRILLVAQLLIAAEGDWSRHHLLKWLRTAQELSFKCLVVQEYPRKQDPKLHNEQTQSIMSEEQRYQRRINGFS